MLLVEAFKVCWLITLGMLVFNVLVLSILFLGRCFLRSKKA